MKQFWCAVCLMTSGLLYATNAPAEATASVPSGAPASAPAGAPAPITAPGVLLQQMSQASKSLSYEFAYVSVSKQGVDSLRFRHALFEKRPFAQLLQMDGPRLEILQRGDEISYFEPGLEPFTLSGDHIVDSLPSIVYADFGRLAQFYDFIPVGRTRVSDRLCDVVRIVARDSTRFGYVVWIDSETKLPLRVDLLDRDGEALEQFRVISFVVDPQVMDMMQGLDKVNLPPLLAVPASEKLQFDWNTNWLPAGTAEVSRSRRTLPGINVPIEARLYSDGLFSFAVNINQATAADSSAERYIRTGRRTVYTDIRNNTEITVVGELPPATAKRIADSVVFKAQP
ncbi:sigma-E factor regulatory protein RseB [Sodalis ligni]|jgi:sigma-E factor negative regulatory protein RseB|uniref:MucB/RseB-like sigma(E) regulatory protein n=1 Tax=Sodalis ligni TaxID=2697027 RepID=A0A4R1NLI9_9GAMM|nr:sigma-E factor regulatory protein RseB [Sodalis ligni]QWA09767.1 sigma-E factor regulatory protein RseB [Sodalis ligni]TCL06831.1 MucB/RseB-like sigma(E) regulatory protein [Sodalis ligni]